MKTKLNKIKDYLLDLIFPKNIKCIFCGEELNELATNSTCVDCKENLPFITSCCDRCGLPVPDDFVGVCQQCKRDNYNFVKARSVFAYSSKVKSLIRKVKFRSKKVFLEQMAKLLHDTFVNWNIKVDLIAYVPMFPKNEKLRGFNQAKILAEELSKLTNIPTTDCCLKIKNTQNQRDLSFQMRKDNIKDAFKIDANKKSTIKNKTILIVDDVFTTGATTSELSETLKLAGAKDCYVLTFAHNELKH